MKSQFREVIIFFWIAIGVATLSVSLTNIYLISTSKYSLPQSCKLSDDAITVKAVADNFQQCKSELKIDLAKPERRFHALVVQLEPNQQLTDNTKNALQAVFQDVEKQFYEQKPSAHMSEDELVSLLRLLGASICLIALIAASVLRSYALRNLR